jgi:hypothetical protein
MSSGRTKIPDALHPTVLDLAGALHPTTRVRWTHAQIADWLRAEHDIAVCPRTVANLLRSLRQEVSHGLQDDARAALLSKLTAQVEAFDTEMDALLHDLHTTPKLKLGDRAEVLEVYRRALDTKLRWAGVGEKVTVEADVSVDATVAVTDARATLAAELAKLSAGPLPDAAG